MERLIPYFSDMKWVYPEFLLAFGLLTIPILIHLFHFRKYKTVFFSSLTFVKNIEQEQKKPKKIKHLLILCCRLLVLSFLILAFARPYFPGKTEDKRTSIIGVYLDNSYSMSRLGEKGELLSQAKELVRSLINQVPYNTQFVLFTNELSGSEKQIYNRKSLVDAVSKINYSPLVRSQEEILSFWNNWLEDHFSSNRKNTTTRLIYLSDFQKNKSINLKVNFNKKDRLMPLVLKPERAGNLYVDSLWFEVPIQRYSAKQTLYVRVTNSGNEPVKDVVVHVQLGKNQRDLFASIPPNSSDTVNLEYFNQEKGIIEGVVSINDKQMFHDDAFFFNYQVQTNCNVLLIDGEDAVKNVAKVYGLDAFYQVKQAVLNEALSQDFSEFDLIVLNGLNQFPSNLAQELTTYLETNGSVLLLPGKAISTSSWNTFLEKNDFPSLNGSLTVGLSIKKINDKDAFFSGVFEKSPKDLLLTSVNKAYRTRFTQHSQAVSLIDFQNGEPFFMKSTSKKSLFALTTSLHPDFSTFTSSELFSTLLLRVGELAQRQTPLYLVIGSESSYPLQMISETDAPVRLLNDQLEYMPVVFTKNNKPVISLQGQEAVRILKAGNYQIKQKELEIGRISLNYNREESKLVERNFDQIKADFSKFGLSLSELEDASKWNSISLIDLNQTVELWRLFVVLAIAFVLTEIALQIFLKN